MGAMEGMVKDVASYLVFSCKIDVRLMWQCRPLLWLLPKSPICTPIPTLSFLPSLVPMPIINEFEDATELLETYGIVPNYLLSPNFSYKGQIFY